MRSMIAQWLVGLLLPLLTAACQPRSAQRCDCRNIHHLYPEGCYIVEPAQPGFKCECYYDTEPLSIGLFSVPSAKCRGEAHPCRNDEWCPGGRYSYCACVQGGGRCSGYPLRPSTVRSCPNVNKLGGISGMRQGRYERCECEWYRGGCRIMKAAPEGFKCYCGENCNAHTIGCDEDEYCPPGDHSYCACLRGGGDCDGYRDKNQVCDLGTTCDCNRSSDWTNGRYTIASVTVDEGKVVRSNPKPLQIGSQLNVPNASGAEQTQSMDFTYTNMSQSSFTRTHGLTVQAGLNFWASLPNQLSTTNSFTFGMTTTTTRQTSHKYSCTSPPKTHTRCTIHLMSFEISAPYTMILKHNAIPNCKCRSYGFWTQKASFLSTLKAEYVGPCPRLVNGSCVEQ